jgi:hypothetical protein
MPDFSGIVYHANYLRFMERGRTNHLRLRVAERYAALTAALRDAWPDAWRGTSVEEDLRRCTSDFDRVAQSMRSSPDLSLDNLVEGNEFLAEIYRRLEELLRAAGHTDSAGAGGPPAFPLAEALLDPDAVLAPLGIERRLPRDQKHPYDASSSSRALACFKSSVSKSSVNQP